MTDIQHKHGTAENLAAVNPVIAKAEICIETDTNKMKIGDGTTEYNDLPYAGGGNVEDMTGATSSTDGAHGLAPKPLAGEQNKSLRADGTWETDTVSRYWNRPQTYTDINGNTYVGGLYLEPYTSNNAVDVPYTQAPATKILSATGTSTNETLYTGLLTMRTADSYEISFIFPTLPSTFGTSRNYIIACSWRSYYSFSIYIDPSDTSKIVACLHDNSYDYTATANLVANHEYTVAFKEGIIYIDNVALTTYHSYTRDWGFYPYSASWSTSVITYAKFTNFKYRRSGTILLDCVPVRPSEGVNAGFFDKVSRRFVSSSTSYPWRLVQSSSPYSDVSPRKLTVNNCNEAVYNTLTKSPSELYFVSREEEQDNIVAVPSAPYVYDKLDELREDIDDIPTYTAGTNVQISSAYAISATDTIGTIRKWNEPITYTDSHGNTYTGGGKLTPYNRGYAFDSYQYVSCMNYLATASMQEIIGTFSTATDKQEIAFYLPEALWQTTETPGSGSPPYVFDLRFTRNGGSSADAYCYVTGTPGNLSLYFHCYWNTYNIPLTNFTPNTVHTFAFDHGDFYLDGEVLYHAGVIASGTHYGAIFNAYNFSSGYRCALAYPVYYKVYKNNSLVYEAVAASRDSDQACGLYSPTDESFVQAYDTTRPYSFSEGDPYTDTKPANVIVNNISENRFSTITKTAGELYYIPRGTEQVDKVVVPNAPYVYSQLDTLNTKTALATTSSAGIVQPDGTSITINNGVISSGLTKKVYTSPAVDSGQLEWVIPEAIPADACVSLMQYDAEEGNYSIYNTEGYPYIVTRLSAGMTVVEISNATGPLPEGYFRLIVIG